MNIGLLLPGFSSDENDWAIPVQLNLVRELAGTDDVRVLALRYPHRRDTYSIFGATVYSLGVGQVRSLRRLKLWLDALITLRRLHRDKPFDVLHAMWADETGLIAAWAGRWLKIPVAVSIAGGELARLDDIGYGLQRGAFSRWIVGQALYGADRVITACTYARSLIDSAGYSIPAEKICIITLGVDTNLFHPALLPLSVYGAEGMGSRHLVHVASLVGVKDQATLLRAIARIDNDVTLDILGVGPERATLESLAENLGILHRVNFVGTVQHLDLPPYYQRATLNVLSSRHEGLGMVTLEAAACGVPTVSTDIGLLPDVPEMGICVPVGDDVALADAIRALLSDEPRRAALAQSAYDTAREHFTIQKTAAQLRDMYRELSSGLL